jgi:hypothetical protein
MESAKAPEPQLAELVDRLIAETEHLIEEGRLLTREIEIAKQDSGILATEDLSKRSQRRAVRRTDQRRKRPDRSEPENLKVYEQMHALAGERVRLAAERRIQLR